MKIKIGDLVKVNIGKDKGKTGKIQKILGKDSKVIVEGINIYKKHVKKSAGGGIVEKTFPLLSSKVSLVCPKCNQPTRVGFTRGAENEKIRVCRKCDQALI